LLPTRARPLRLHALLVVLHGDWPVLGGARYCLSDLDVVDIGRGAARTASRLHEGGSRRLDLRLPGVAISKAHGRLRRLGDAWTLEDLGSKNGVFRNGDRITSAALRDGDSNLEQEAFNSRVDAKD
jgi:pSer/pThr/pTyr-binding forkhead associated (FHA) protein